MGEGLLVAMNTNVSVDGVEIRDGMAKFESRKHQWKYNIYHRSIYLYICTLKRQEHATRLNI